MVQKPGFWTKIPQAPGTCVATQLLVHSNNGHAVRYANGAALKPFEPGGTAKVYNVSGEAQLRNRKASQDVQPAAARTGSETRARKISCPPAAPCALLKKKSLCQRPIPKILGPTIFCPFSCINHRGPRAASMLRGCLKPFSVIFSYFWSGRFVFSSIPVRSFFCVRVCACVCPPGQCFRYSSFWPKSHFSLRENRNFREFLSKNPGFCTKNQLQKKKTERKIAKTGKARVKTGITEALVRREPHKLVVEQLAKMKS